MGITKREWEGLGILKAIPAHLYCVSSAYVWHVKLHSAMTLNSSAVYSRNKMGPKTDPCGPVGHRTAAATLPTDVPCTVQYPL